MRHRDIIIPLLLLLASAVRAEESALAEAERLLASGDAESAWQLLAPREADWAGNPLYDYLLGIAALDSGKRSDAVFSLERALTVNPEFDGARMDLARAYYESGDYESARAQFAYLAGRTPPAPTAAVIDRYLAAIDLRVGQRQQRFGFYFNTGAGWDSNANGSTSDELFQGFDLDDRNVEADSAYLALSGGVEHSAGFGNGLAWASGLDLSYRTNPDAHFVDQLVASAGTALYWSPAPWRFDLGLGGYYGWLDGSRHDSYVGLTAGLARLLGERWEIGARLQGGPVRYHDEALDVLEADRLLGTVSLSILGLASPGSRIDLSLFGGTDDVDDADSAHGNDRLGGRVTTRWPFGQGHALRIEASYTDIDYDYGDGPGFFSIDRQDEQTTARIALEFADWPAQRWHFTPHVRWVDSSSNVLLYDYDRWEAGVNLGWSQH